MTAAYAFDIFYGSVKDQPEPMSTIKPEPCKASAGSRNVKPQAESYSTHGGAGGARTHDPRIMSPLL